MPAVDSYMQLAVYNLLGGTVCTARSAPSSAPHTLFTRIRHLIKGHVADPDFGPPEAASQLGSRALPAEALYPTWPHLHRFYLSLRLNQAASLSIAVACWTQRAHQRHCLRVRISDYTPLRSKISPSLRLLAGRSFRAQGRGPNSAVARRCQ